MATAAIIREGLAKAKRYLDGIREYESDRENSELPEYDIKCEALLPLLRNETTAYFHCHRADDIFTALRISKEFGIKPVLIHATEGHLIADILGRENVTAIAGPILCDRCKPEMKSLELKNAGALAENGVKTAICTDHTVVPIQYLPLSAAGGGKGRNELRGRVEGNNLQCGGGRRNSGPNRQYRGRKRRGSSALS